jgi:hypothetical protein
LAGMSASGGWGVDAGALAAPTQTAAPGMGAAVQVRVGTAFPQAQQHARSPACTQEG